MKIKGTTLYLVGGCVRDRILKKESNDRDFVALTKLSFTKLCTEINKIGVIFQAKPKFFTIRCNIENEVVDIAFPRSEKGYDDNRHPTIVRRVKTLRADAQRRDFRMNSIYLNEEKGERGYIDYFGGISDIQKKIIRTVGSPIRRFKEDYLRILRAIRFACQLNFRIEAVTFVAMKKLASKLQKVEPNRVRKEINKALIANPKKAITYINKLKLWPILESMGLHFQLTSKKIKK